jgi:phenylacetate-coenzyme A ligase PaaK-like adenylate-forming protein
MQNQWNHKIFTIKEAGFESLALEIFRFQYASNPVYREYVKALHINASDVRSIMQIPFLPIRFFKSHAVQTTAFEPEVIFESSGTTGSTNGRHLVKDVSLYKEGFTKGFELMYGPVKDWCIIGLLPSYLERNNSSLVYMVNELIRQSQHQQSGFYLDEHDNLVSVLTSLEKCGQKTILIGVTFALLDFAEKYPPDSYREPLQHTIVMETGGMKGRKKEMIRQEVHSIFQKKFSIESVHSEYGMTELLSQAYSKENGIFHCPPWMKVLIRDEEDPFSIQSGDGRWESGVGSREMGAGSNFRHRAQTGAINIIDLANIYSCSFIATDDGGKLYSDGSFEVLGRLDNSDLRGCSLMTM